MTDTKDRLNQLLPFVYRLRDAEQGLPLRALLRVLSEQVDVVEADVAQLYENWFIETSQEWVVPYIGELVGFEPVFEAGQPGEAETTQGQLRNKILVPRAEVANTIRNRRRKGTLALLELLARDVARWPARAVEFFQLLGVTQSLNHLRLERGRTVDLRNGDALSRLNGPFDEIAHTVDVRRPNSHRTLGRYNVPSVGLFIWRLQAYSVTRTPAYFLEGSNIEAFSFSLLGNDVQLYSPWRPEKEPTQIANELNLPAPIRREALEETVPQPDGTVKTRLCENYYGTQNSFAIWASEDWPGWSIRPEANPNEPIPCDAIIPANLATSHAESESEGLVQYEPKPGKVAVDPKHGLMVFAPNQRPEKVWVFYHYGFSADLGGGEYERPLIQPSGSPLLHDDDLNDFEAWARKLAAQTDPASNDLYEQFSSETQTLLRKLKDDGVLPDEEWNKLRSALREDLNVLIASTSFYDLPGFKLITLRPETRQLIEENPQDDDLLLLNRMLLEDAYPNELALLLLIWRVGENENLKTINAALSQWENKKPRHGIIEITDSGAYTEQIKITMLRGKSLQIRAANLRRPVLRLLDYKPSGLDAVVVIGAENARFDIDGLLVSGRGLEVKGEMDEVNIRHCTLVPGWDIDHGCEPQYSSKDSLFLLNTKARVSISHSIVGSIQVRQDEITTDPIQLTVSDSIIDATSDEEEAIGEPGCPVAHAIVTIRRSTVIGEVQTHAIELAENSIFTGTVTVARRQIGCMRFCYVPHGSRTPRRYNCQPDLVEKPIREQRRRNEIDEAQMLRRLEDERLRVRPQFTGAPPRYGTPEYCQLADVCAEEIKRGADDESEMGAFHDLYQPQREANLRSRLEEYTPAGMDAGIFFAS